MRDESVKTWAEAEGEPFPLGATWCEQDRAFNFALYSHNATGVELLLYSKKDVIRPLLQCRLDRYLPKNNLQSGPALARPFIFQFGQ